MHGEINVIEVMDRTERLRVWQEQQSRNAEWVALKQWWRDDQRYRRARTGLERWRASLDRAKTAWLYRAELERGWPKWRAARAARWGGVVLDEDPV